MKKLLPILIIAVSLFTSCENGLFKNRFTITGEVDGYSGKYIYATHENYKECIVYDTIKIESGKFKFTAKSDDETPLYLFDESHKPIIALLVKNGDKITLKGEFTPYKPEISGNEVNTLIGEFYNANAPVLQQLDNLRSEYSVNYNDTVYLNKLHSVTDSISTIATSFVRSHTDSPAALFIIYKYIVSHKNRDLTRSLLELLTPEAKPEVLAARIEKFAALQRYDKGKVMPYTQLYNETDSAIFSFNKKNQLTVVTFWTISDSLSRKTLRELRHSVYDQYPAAKLQMHSISVDLDKVAWRNVIKSEAFPWSQSIIPDGWNSQTVKSLSISHIPSMFLLDRNGLIIARDINPDSLKILIKKTIERNDSIDDARRAAEKDKGKKK